MCSNSSIVESNKSTTRTTILRISPVDDDSSKRLDVGAQPAESLPLELAVSCWSLQDIRLETALEVALRDQALLLAYSA
jgi:hypothetical protein